MSPPIFSTNAVIDLTLADRAILSIRSSPAKALEYEHDWSKSNVSELSNWITATLHATSKSSQGLACLQAAVCTLIESILDTTTASLSSRVRPPLTTLSEGQQASLNAALLRFSTRAHSSLLQNLDHAFDPLSSPLSSLPFYALLFRIDDLPTLTANLLSRYFLVTPDKEFIFLTARLLEAGYFQSSLTPRSPLEPIDAERVLSDAHAETIATRRLGSIPPRPTFSDLVPPTPATTSLDQPPAIPEADRPDSPWHTPLATSRQQLISSTIPPLHAAAQRLLLHFLSTTSTSALLGVLVYISAVANAGAYEASALTALGLVIALRRLQTGWNRLRSSWEDDVREEGRRILREAESIVLVRIKRAQDSRSAEAAQLERESGHVEAMAAVNKVRQALTQLPVQKTSTS